ncbi:MAG TPA: 30S ribosomal protein S14 [Candidatus Nanoarchaeia archaeon]|nr:30S ribosomal protein S14 [Candidatus Nanoarchaeia archaeon]
MANNAPKKRSCGFNRYHCKRCGQTHAHIAKYGLHICRLCFRDIATQIGFKKYS